MSGAPQPVAIDESSATINVAAKVNPAVVRITVTGASGAGDLGVIPATGVGSGVIFNSNGWILTNHHVVEGGTKFDVQLYDGRVLSGSVYGIDTLTDLAIVKVDATGLPTASIGESDALKVGQLVVAIGSPLGTYSNSVTSGIVSAKGRSITTDGNQSLTNLIQTDAAINPGNSGGPLLDADGNIVGINTAIASNSNGIGFAIPIDIARPIMDQAVAGQKLTRPYLGIRFVSITRQLADDEKLPVQEGALVGGRDANGNPTTGVEAGTPAAAAGIKDGDIIVSVNGKAIDEGHPLDATLAQFSPGDTVSVDVLRDGTARDAPGDARDATRRASRRDASDAEAGSGLGVAPQAPARLPPEAEDRRVGRSRRRRRPGSPPDPSGCAGAAGSRATSTRTSMKSRNRTGVRSSPGSSAQPAAGPRVGRAGVPGAPGASSDSQHSRISSPWSGRRWRSRPQ